MFHGVHHAAPRDRTRLVMPPAGGILLLIVLYQVFRLRRSRAVDRAFHRLLPHRLSRLRLHPLRDASFRDALAAPALPQGLSPAAPLRREGRALWRELAAVGSGVRHVSRRPARSWRLTSFAAAARALHQPKARRAARDLARNGSRGVARRVRARRARSRAGAFRRRRYSRPVGRPPRQRQAQGRRLRSRTATASCAGASTG